MNFIKRWLEGGLRSISIVVLCCFLLSAFSDRISPEVTVIPSFLGILFPFFLIPAFLVTLYWALRKSLFALVCFAFLFVGSDSITRYFPITLSSPFADEAPQIKLLSYNTCGFGESKGSTKEMIDFIKQQDADIVCLQEFRIKKRSDGLSLSQIKRKFKNYRYFHYSTASPTNYTGLAFFSKYPIKSTRSLKFESRYNHACLVEVEVDGQRVNVINNHLESNHLSLKDREVYQDAIRDFDTKKMDVVRTNLFSKLAKSYRVRATQVQTIRELLDKLNDPVILCGDLNDTPISYSYQHLKGDMYDVFAERGNGLGITYHENHFLFRIDHIFHTEQFESNDVKIHHVKYSDHYPITVGLNLSKK